LVAEGDKVVGRNSVTGTHQGEYMGLAPTGKSVAYNEIFIFRFTGGRIAETWGVVDVFSQLKQLGVISGLAPWGETRGPTPSPSLPAECPSRITVGAVHGMD
jgi:SnoaL-like polyketide cyclase